MNDELKPTLNLVQLNRTAEDEIKKCDLDPDSPLYPWELTKAWTIFDFWYLLALQGNSGLSDGSKHIEENSQRLQSLIHTMKKN